MGKLFPLQVSLFARKPKELGISPFRHALISIAPAKTYETAHRLLAKNRVQISSPASGVGRTRLLSISISAVEPPSDKGDRVVTGGDLAFMNDAAPGGLAEVELGRLAGESAASSEVKAFARQMTEDHAKAGEKLKKLAQQKQVVLPEAILPKAKQTKEMLSKLQGAEFDPAYVKAMLEVHLTDVAAFEAVAKNATDADVKAFAGETVPTLKHHLEMIRAIAQTMKIEVN